MRSDFAWRVLVRRAFAATVIGVLVYEAALLLRIHAHPERFPTRWPYATAPGPDHTYLTSRAWIVMAAELLIAGLVAFGRAGASRAVAALVGLWLVEQVVTELLLTSVQVPGVPFDTALLACVALVHLAYAMFGRRRGRTGGG